MACICANLLFPAPAWSSGAPPTAATSIQTGKQILFVEDNVADYRELIGNGTDHMDVVVLDGEHDGLRQIAQALETRRDIAGLHLISHGAPGSLQLGSLQLDRQQLNERGADLGIIRAALRRDADILLYGCNVAEGKAGQDFIGALAGRTGARVAASSNLTGAATQGGDWMLEARTGPLRSAALTFPAYRHVLPSVAGTMQIPFGQADTSFSTASIVDGQAGTGSTNIPNVVYEFYFADTADIRVGQVRNLDLTGGTGSMFLFYNAGQYGAVGSLIVKAQSNRSFGISSFRIQDAQFINSTYTLTGYRNGTLTVAGWTFTTGGSTNPVTISPPAQFTNVDELRITSNGGTGGVGAKLYQEGFNSFVFTEPTANAALSGLSATAGALSPAFATATTAYTIAVPNATASTTITPTVDTPGTTVTVNGVTVASGAASGAIALNVGANTITTIVTALDGSTTKTYTTTITRAAPPSSNANLSNMAISTGTLTPVFASGTTSYTAGVPFTTTSMTLTPTVADGTASVTVNGVATTSGNASGAIALNVGANTITTIVTAQDSSTKTYTTTVTRAAASSSNQLSALSLSSGTLAPVFASGTIGYTATVSNATTSITVTPTVLDASASVTVNGVATTSGNASGAIALAIGSNTITVTVTAQNGTPLSYTVTVTRAGSANADLSALSLSSGTLSPAFAAGTTSYTASVSNATTSLTVTPTVANGSASVTVNGVATTSGSASGAIALNVGANTITTIVTAQDGSTTKTYTVTVTRAASSNNNLSALSTSSGSLSPVFNPATTGYTVSIAAGIASITVTPTTAVGTASITVNGVAVSSGAASGAIAMNPGSNTVTVDVTAQNGATKSYTLTITRALPSTNADLSALSLSSGTLNPAFAASTTSYTASVSNATTSLTVTPTVLDATASVTVNGVATTSGNASGAIALAVGANTITTIVTAQNGTTTKTYTVTVTRAGSGDANLSALALSGGSLSPAFAPSTTGYTMSIAAATASVTVTPTVNEPNATVTVNGVAVASGNASGAIAMNTGSNTVTVVVTAQNSATRTYTVTVTRAISTNNDLAALALSSGTLNPVFSAAQQSYSATVPNATTSITVTPTVADSSASVTVNGVATTSGNASGAIALNTGANIITVVVTAQDGSPRSYTITVTRNVSSNADLSALALSSGTLSPAFAAGTTNYTASVSNATASLTVTPTVADPTATVTVNGMATTSGNASGAIALNTGANIVTIAVTAQNSTTRTYTVTVTRTVSANNNLSALALSSSTLSPSFTAGTTSYTASVSNATASLTVTPTVADPTATVTVNGMATISGNASGAIALALGANTITVQVNAPNGAVKTYTITVTRATSANAALSALVPSIGSLSPAFASATTAYAIDLPNSATALSLTPTVADSSAMVTVNGAPVASASASAPVALAVGDNTVTIVVTAQNGTAVTTTVKVTRAPLATASLAGLVYTDNNHDGVRDSGETGLAGVTVKLDGTDLDGAAVALSTVTGTDGGFAFNTIKGGTYTLTEVQPAAKRDGRETAGNLGGTVDNSGFDDSAARNQIGNIVIASGQAGSGYLFGEQNSGTLQGFVYVDTNDNGIKDAGETPLSGVRINLSGSVTGVATSGTDGSFSFPAIAAGSYSLSRNVADLDGAQYSDGRERAGAAGGKVNDTGFGTLPFQTSISVIDVDGAKLAASGGKLDGYLFGLRKRAANGIKLPIISGAVQLSSKPTPGHSGGALVAGWNVTLSQNDKQICGVSSDAQGQYQFNNLVCPGYEQSGLPTGSGFTIRFNKSGSNLGGKPDSGGEAGLESPRAIRNLSLSASDEISQQNLPLDPAGVVYDSVSRQPLAGVTVTIDGPPGFDPATHLVGGAAIKNQLTGADGAYQYLLQNGFPSGVYTLAVLTAPAGYGTVSALLPPCAGTLNVGAVPDPAFIQSSDVAPGTGVARHDPAACTGLVQGGSASTQYYLKLHITNGMSAPILNDHIPLDAAVAAGLSLSKTGDRQSVELGDTVRYTIVLRQSAASTIRQASVRDVLPSGFRFIPGSVTLNGARAADPVVGPGAVLGFQLGGATAGRELVLGYRVRVGVGSMQGDGVNRARAYVCNSADGCLDAATLAPRAGSTTSNEASFKVQVSGGVFTNEACVAGKVFTDCNRNGVQDAGEAGIPAVRLYLEDGTNITTDADGKYSYCGLSPTAHVIKVDPVTLPAGSVLGETSNRNLSDPDSLLLDVRNGELIRADFAETSCAAPVLERIRLPRSPQSGQAPPSVGGPGVTFSSKVKNKVNSNSAGKPSVAEPVQGEQHAQ